MITKTKRKQRAPKVKGFKIKAKPLTEEQITMFVSHFNKYSSFPGSKIPCSVTGKLTTCVGPWLKKKIKEFGSAEGLLRGYKCRSIAKAQKIRTIGSRKHRTKEHGEKEQGRYNVPSIDSFVKSPPYDPAEESKSVCLRPDIFLSNDRHCDGCHYFKICQNRLKTLPKHISFDGEKFVYDEKKAKK